MPGENVGTATKFLARNSIYILKAIAVFWFLVSSRQHKESMNTKLESGVERPRWQGRCSTALANLRRIVRSDTQKEKAATLGKPSLAALGAGNYCRRGRQERRAYG
jgi:hypothetical protein